MIKRVQCRSGVLVDVANWFGRSVDRRRGCFGRCGHVCERIMGILRIYDGRWLCRSAQSWRSRRAEPPPLSSGAQPLYYIDSDEFQPHSLDPTLGYSRPKLRVKLNKVRNNGWITRRSNIINILRIRQWYVAVNVQRSTFNMHPIPTSGQTQSHERALL